MAILESAVVLDIGLPFIKACYQLEGDAPLILSANKIFEALDKHINSKCTFKETKTIIPEVLSLLSEAESPFIIKLNQKEEAKENIEKTL